ncbi:MAG: carbon-nitrogen hydrolase family protein [Mesorhizobium sp.]
MNKLVRIATTSMATLEAISPPYNLSEPDPKLSLARGLELIDAAGAQNADLVCLPETFATAGLDSQRSAAFVEPADGPSFAALAERARANRINVVAGALQWENDRISNVAVLFGRDGERIGSYSKRHPTEGEIEGGVVPGVSAGVFDTDIGRVGLAICFDLNWRQLWQEMKAQGAEIVCWLSAYEGGFPLQAYAWMHDFVVVSSVQSYVGKIIDRTGTVLTTTSRWGRLTSWDVDLDQRWFHTDGQAEKIIAVQQRYGGRVRVETRGEEHLFSITRQDPGLSIDEIIAELGLVQLDDYLDRCTLAQKRERDRDRGRNG